MDLLTFLQQLTAIQYALPTFTPQHAKKWSTEDEGILNGTFIFDPAFCFFKVVRAFGMETMSTMLELMEAAPSTAALVLLK